MSGRRAGAEPGGGQGRAWTVAAVAASLAALGLGGAAAIQAQDGPVPELAEICLAYDDLRASLTRTLGGQVRLRSAAARLADLTQRYPEQPTPVGRPVHAASGTLRLVLAAPHLTVRDLFVAACPAAEACGHADQCREAARLDPDR